MFKNPISYYKLTDGSWDFDTLMDMLFSFFVLTEIPDTHPKVSERLPYAPPSSCAAAPHRPRVAAPRPSRNLLRGSQAVVLKAAGITFKCSCPRFGHYHMCKHSIAMGIATGKVLPCPATRPALPPHHPRSPPPSQPRHLPRLALSMQVCVPVNQDVRHVGKRKAPAGAKLAKRGKCLEIDS